MIKDIKLPEIADNVTTATVLEIVVKVGDQVNADDTLAELESDKATFELPSDVSGIVKEINASPGDEIKVGQVMFRIETGNVTEKDSEPVTDSNEGVPEKKDKDRAVSEKTNNQQPEEGQQKKAEITETNKNDQEVLKVKDSDSTNSLVNVAASPSVRRLAREIGVDITKVTGSGPNSRINIDDVKGYAKSILEGGGGAGPATILADRYELPDFTKYGEVRREKMDNIRKITAKTMVESWQSIPHVFQFDKADVTEIEAFRKKYSKHVEKEGAKLTFTAILLKITAQALKTFPKFNASIDMKNEEIIFKEYVNIGIAVDTDRGLLVPVIKSADKKSITELSIELNTMAEKARNKKIMPDDMQGGNFAISNLGGIGGTNFTPIVYRPNVAILGVSRSQTEPVYIDGEFKPRLMLPLSLSYDHRLIDGADGARFLRWISEALENPILTMFK